MTGNNPQFPRPDAETVRAAHLFKLDFAHRIRSRWNEVCVWFQEKARAAPPPFYCSVDLRDAGFKVVPVDSNLYPAGFNNICPEDQRTSSPIIRAHIDSKALKFGLDKVQKILLIPEAHTTNVYYAENLYYLCHLIREAGYEVQIGWYPYLESECGKSALPTPNTDMTPRPVIQLTSATGKILDAHAIRVQQNGSLITDEGFVPDLVILNNDFSSGYPKCLDRVQQPILPSHRLGWHTRKKSRHFEFYNELAREFSELVGIDPWRIQIDSAEVKDVNFNEDQGLERVIEQAQTILGRTTDAYATHHVNREPFVFIKNNSGTYGMGIMVIKSIDELKQMNRRTKNKMSVGKNKLPIESVVLQEGVPTATLVDRLAAEPVIYLLGCELIGGFLRTNTERGTDDNLNSQGMVFRRLCMSDLHELSDTPGLAETSEVQSLDQTYPHSKDEPILEIVYGAVARLSALATGLELAEMKSN